MNESALPALDARLAEPTVSLDETDNRVVLHLDPALSFSELEIALRLVLDGRPDLRNRGATLAFSDREVALFDLRRLTRFLAEEYELTVASVVITERALLRYAQSVLKVRLQVQGDERTWSMASARPVPMASAHAGLPAVCEDADDDPASTSVAAPPTQRCGVGVVEEDAPCPVACASIEPAPLGGPDDSPRAAAVLPEQGASGAAGGAAVGKVGRAPGEVPAGDCESGKGGPHRPEGFAPAGGETGRVQTVHRTLRSGVTVRHNGDLIVFGDVNAGAQVVADGNIVVLGALRGVAHAGARGDESASVVAFQLQSSQVRIASHIALPPEREGRPESAGSALRTLLQRDRVPERSFFPEIAQLQGGAIVFGPFRGRLSSAGRS